MRRRFLLMVIGLFCSLDFMPLGHAIEILRWERLPLSVPLVVGQERVVFIDRHVRVGLPGDIGNRLRVQSAGGAIYLRASEVLPATRLQLQDVASGAIILLDVVAVAAGKGAAPLEPIRIVVVADNAPDSDAAGGDAVPRRTPVPVLLTRYAAQNLYAPLRTLEPVAGIARVNLRGDMPVDTLLPTLPVHARALAAWRLEDQWVTAVRLTNTSARCVGLDPRALQGDFVAATFQHAYMGPAGSGTDTTVVYVVTRGRGLAGALLPAISRFDAGVNMPVGQPDAAPDTTQEGCHAK